MLFDPENIINQLCSRGMELEAEGKADEARNLFQQAWDEAVTDTEKFVAAHYFARQQENISAKLSWDQAALDFAIKTDNAEAKAAYASLYLNVAKGYEDLNDPAKARESYLLALHYTKFLNPGGYGNMIRAGIENGIKRVH